MTLFTPKKNIIAEIRRQSFLYCCYQPLSLIAIVCVVGMISLIFFDHLNFMFPAITIYILWIMVSNFYLAKMDAILCPKCYKSLMNKRGNYIFIPDKLVCYNCGHICLYEKSEN